MGFKARITFIAGDKFSGIAERVGRSTRKMSKSIKEAGARAKKATAKFKDLGKNMQTAGMKLLGFGAGMAALAGLALKKSGDIESMRVSFQTLTHDVDKGNAALQSVIEFTASTPFELKGVSSVATGLLAVGFKTEELTSKLRVLADVSAGVSKPIEDVAQAYLKAKSTGKLSTEVLNQFLEKNIVLWPELEKNLGKNKVQIQKLMSAGKLGFNVLDDALANMSKEGGAFYQMTEKQSKTFNGLFSTMSDNWGFALVAIGDTLEELFGVKAVMGSVIERLQKFTKAFPEWAKENKGLIKLGVGLSIAAVAIGAILIPLGAFMALVPFIAVGAMMLGAAFSVAFSPVTLAVIAIGALVAAGWWLYKNWETVSGKFMAIYDGIADKIGAVQSFFGFGDSNITGSMDSSKMALETNTKNRSEVVVKLEAPPGTVREVSSTSTADATVDVGEYMPIPSGAGA